MRSVRYEGGMEREEGEAEGEDWVGWWESSQCWPEDPLSGRPLIYNRTVTGRDREWQSERRVRGLSERRYENKRIE